MKDSIPAVTRAEYLDGDVTPKVRVTIRRTRLDFGTELHYKSDSTIPGIIVDFPDEPDRIDPADVSFWMTTADGDEPYGEAPLTVTIVNASADGPTEWFWEFGDGGTSTERYPGTYTYNTVGRYDASLTVSNAAGSEKLIRYDYVVVTDPASELEANFRGVSHGTGYDPPRGTEPLMVMFTDYSVGSPDTFLWTFGDGDISSLQNPGGHEYTSKGVYTVSLQVWDADGKTHTLTKDNYVTVTEYVEPPDPPTGEHFYVSRLGSDSTGDGSILNPWRHIQFGIDRMSPGTTLNIRGADGGRFDEVIRLENKKGTASAWYTLYSYDGPSAPAIIDGEYDRPTGDWDRYDPSTGKGFVYKGLVKIENCEHLKLDGIHVTRSRGLGIFAKVVHPGTGHHLTFVNGKSFSCRASTFKALGFESHVIMEDYELYDSMNYCQYRRAVAKGPTGLNWSSSCTIAEGSDHAVRRTLCYNSYGEGIHAYTWQGGVVEDNVVFNCLSGMLPTASCDGTVKQRNFVYSTQVEPFLKAAQLNMSTDPVSSDSRSQVSKNCRIINNIVVDGYICNRWMDRSGSDGDLRWGYFRDTVYSHNTLVQHFLGRIDKESLIRWLPMTHFNDIKEIDICNNIHWSNGTSANIIKMGNPKPDPTYRYNCWSMRPDEATARGAGDKYDCDPQMVNVNANLTADGTYGIDFLREQAREYMLKDTSPVIGQGRNTQGDTYPVTEDFWGNARGTSPDMGAHEQS